MAICPVCNNSFNRDNTMRSEKCKFCVYVDNELDQTVQEEFNTLINPSGVTQVPRYDDDEE